MMNCEFGGSFFYAILVWILLELSLREPGKTASYFVAAGRRRPLSLRGPVFVPEHEPQDHHDDQRLRDPLYKLAQALPQIGILERGATKGSPYSTLARKKAPGASESSPFTDGSPQLRQRLEQPFCAWRATGSPDGRLLRSGSEFHAAARRRGVFGARGARDGDALL